MSTIDISQIVTVNPAVLSAAGSAVDLNGLVLTQNTSVPIGSVPGFANAPDVAAFFGSVSTEATIANIYFSGYENSFKKPGLLYFAQYNTAAVAGYLRGGSLSGMTLTQLQALSGVLTVSVDGVSKTSSTINLSSATSFSNAATLIQAGFTSFGATVTYNAQLASFVITSSSTGASSSISFATGTLSAGLKLTSATGAVTSAGAIAAVPATFMDALIQVTQNWALFMTAWEPDLANKSAFTDWTAGKEPRYGYVGADSDVNAKVANSTNTWGYYVRNNGKDGSVLVYGDYTHAAFVLGYAASLDFTRLNGRATLAFKRNSILNPSVSNSTDASNLLANGYNFYGNYANSKENFIFFYNGSISGQYDWLDSYLNQIWLNANLQLAMVNLLLSVGSIPYNAAGYSLVEASCLDPINSALNFGAIRAGTILSASQKEQIQFALGKDVSPTIEAKGWYLEIVPATAQIRVQRASPSMTLLYSDGGSIQQLTLASILIQ